MDNRILKQLYEQFGTELYLYLYSLCHDHSLHLTPENVRVLSYRAKKELKIYMEANGYDLS